MGLTLWVANSLREGGIEGGRVKGGRSEKEKEKNRERERERERESEGTEK